MFRIRLELLLLLIVLVQITTCMQTQQVTNTREDIRGKRDIPIAGQALQATSQVLNHPIVAAALQKISMDALATVASALNQVNQEERAKKSNIEMSRTLDKMASLKKASEHHMPMLEDSTGGSGDDDDMSGSGSGDDSNQSNNTSTVATRRSHIERVTKKNKKHHHHHHHKRHHHHHHGKNHKQNKNIKTVSKQQSNETTGILDWFEVEKNASLVDSLAMHANVPVKRFFDIWESGASRSDIARQTEALLNRSITTQADLAALYKEEEVLKEDEGMNNKRKVIEKSINGVKPLHNNFKSTPDGVKLIANGGKSNAVKTLSNDTLKSKFNLKNKTRAFVIPKGIPQQCGKLVKAYTDGEMTLRDYLKELTKCKRGEATAKKLANTTPQQREAVATENVINQEAYKYALNTMKSAKPTVKETANAVLDKWRTNSFGAKKGMTLNENKVPVPDTVKNFMNVQSVSIPQVKPKLEEALNNINTPVAPKQDSFESAKSMILSHVTGDTDSSLVDNTDSSLVSDADSSLVSDSSNFPNNIEDFKTSLLGEEITKRTNIPRMPQAPVFTHNPMSSINSETPVLQLGDNSQFFQTSNDVETFGVHHILPQQAEVHALSPKVGLPSLQENVKQNIISRSNIINPIPKTIIKQQINLPQQTSFQTQASLQQQIKPVQQIEVNPLIKKSLIPELQSNSRISLLQNHLLSQQTATMKGQSTLEQAPVKGSPIFEQAAIRDPSSLEQEVVKGPPTLEQALSARSKISSAAFQQPLAMQQKSIIEATEAVVPQKQVASFNPFVSSTNTFNVGVNAEQLPSITASTILSDIKLQNEKINTLSGQELAAEQIIASLANPVLKEMPVDMSLVAALNEMTAGSKDPLEADPKQSIAMASLMKRQVSDSKKHKKRQLSEPSETRHPRKRDLFDVIGKRHKRHRSKSNGKRDTTDKVKSAKAIERSKMGLPLVSSQQGPKLMDKIRDMSRVIATP